MKKDKTWLILIIIGVAGMLGGAICSTIALLQPEIAAQSLDFPDIPSAKSQATYSYLTGLEVSADTKTAPVYCVQTPNGLDGGRPQAGMDQAGVVFEAIAEAGITRFAAIYQNPTTAVIGPIRSLRLYYLQWDTPFNCMVVHAGGADDALAAIKNNQYWDLTENYTYMYRSSIGNRLWNNLFTTSAKLAQAAANAGYESANINGFTRMSPQKAAQDLADYATEKLVITEASNGQTSTITAPVIDIVLRFGSVASFNVKYQYDSATNSYLRSYETGVPHEVYSCPSEDLGTASPENACTLKQLAPQVVIAMSVSEKKSWDNYHEDITTVGSGDVVIFQNGRAVTGHWIKSTVADQIRFYDATGSEIALVPGQTFVEAIPTYGAIEY